MAHIKLLLAGQQRFITVAPLRFAKLVSKMSFFMGPATSGYSVDPQKIETADQQLEMLTELHRDIIDTCKRKCFAKHYAEGELTKGEMCCVDRCTSKFFTANIIIGKYLGEKNLSTELLSPSMAVLPTLGQHREIPHK